MKIINTFILLLVATAVAVGQTTTTVVYEAMSFTFEGVEQSGTFVDGIPWVVGTNVVLVSTTPAEALLNGDAINGLTINPVTGGKQSWDQRLDWTYVAPAHSYPVSLSANDILVKAIAEPSVTNRRDGYIREYGACVVLSAAPPVNAMAPAIIGWTGRTGLDMHEIDFDSVLDDLPSLPAGGLRNRDFTEIMDYFDRFNPGLAFRKGAHLGYEDHMPHKYGINGSTNYGRYVGGTIGYATLALISDAYTREQKRALAIRMAQTGIQWFDPLTEAGITVGADGGHYQFHHVPVACALLWTGRESMVQNLPNTMPGNLFWQPLRVDAATLASLEPHDSGSLPGVSRRRTLGSNSVNGLDITIPTKRVNITYDPYRLQLVNMYMTRESDGAQAMVVAMPEDIYPEANAESTLLVTIDQQPNPPFAPGDVITFTPSYAIEVGDYDWSVRLDYSSWYRPNHPISYRGLNFWNEEVLFFKALGLDYASFDALYGYTYRANLPDNPTQLVDFPDHSDSDMAEDYWNAFADMLYGDPLSAEAGPAQTLTDTDDNGSELVTLSAGGSLGTIVSYAWTLAGNTLATDVNPTLSLPVGEHMITLTVTNDQNATASDTVLITVLAELPPVADAGNDQSVYNGFTVTLNGSGSTDPNGDTLTYAWTQTTGPTVNLNNAQGVSPTFIAPNDATLSFELTVTANGKSSSDTVTMTSSEAPSLPVNGLVHAWLFEEGSGNTASNSVNSNYHGTLNAPSWSSGQVGNALLFDGSVDRVEIPSFNLSGDAFTLSLWMNLQSQGTADARLFSKASSTASNDHDLMLSTINNQALRVRLKTDASSSTFTQIGPDNSFALNTWHHVAVIYDGSTLSLLVDGAVLQSDAVSGTIAQSTKAVALGNQPQDAGDRPMDGSLDQVRLYERALSAQEIQALIDENADPADDTTPPTVAITSPSANATVDGAIVITATASDDVSVAQVAFQVNGVEVAVDTAAPYSLSWDTSTVNNGIYNLTAIATDTTGNSNSTTQSVTVNNSVTDGITNYYCDPVNGSMLNEGTPSSPWASLAAVMAAGKTFADGDTIYLMNGNHGHPVITESNTANVTITPYPTHTPIISSIDFNGATHWFLKDVKVSAEGAAFPDQNVPLDHPVYPKAPNALVYLLNSNHITIENCQISSIDDNSAWTTENDWNFKAWNGVMTKGGNNISITGCHIKNVNFGLAGGSSNYRLSHNIVENFNGDGIQFGSNYATIEYNTIMNCYATNGNHHDMIQFYAGSGTHYGVTLRGNKFINYTDPNQPFRGSAQGIGFFDGMHHDFVFENNLVVADHWHGLTVLGATNCKVINNTVVDINNSRPGPAWIQIKASKAGTPSNGNIIRNNLCTALSNDSGIGSVDNNVVIQWSDYANYFNDHVNSDYSLSSSSPAIDAGSVVDAPITDINGNVRDENVDIGCYEYGGLPNNIMMYQGETSVTVGEKVWPATHGQAHICLWKDDKTAALTIGVDDNCKPDHAWWLSMQEKYDFNMTWWVVTDGVEGDDIQFNGTWDDYRQLHAAGNEIASHSVTHDCEMTSADWDWQLRDSKATIEQEIGNGYLAKTYAGPCGNTPDRSITEKYYIAHRGVVGGTNSALGDDMNSHRVISSNPDTVFDPNEILTPGLDTWRAKYRGWRIQFYHYLQDKYTETEQNLLAPMAQHRDELFIAPYGDVAMYISQRNTATLTVTEVAADTVSFNLTDKMLDTYFDYPLTVKVRVNNESSTVAAYQGGQSINAKLITHNGNQYALVDAVPDRGLVTLQTSGSVGSGDTTPPSIVITSPLSDTILSDTVTVVAEASDDVAVAQVAFEINGVQVGVDTTAPYEYNWNTTEVDDNIDFSITAVATDTSGNTSASSINVTVDNIPSYQIDSNWLSIFFTSQNDFFEVTFDVVPASNNIDGVVGIAASSALTYDHLAAIVRFNTSGMLDSRNGNIYDSDAIIPYQAGVTYTVRMRIDVVNHTYSVWVTPAAQSEMLLANNYDFSTAQNTVTSLSVIASVNTSGTHTLSGLDVKPVDRELTPQSYADFKTTYNISEAAADNDGDGLPNLFEYFAGLDPTVADAMDTVLWMEADGATASFNFISPVNGRSDLAVEVQKSTDMSTWTTIATRNGNNAWTNPTELTRVPQSDGMEHIQVYESIDNNTPCFYRLRIEEL